MCGIIGIIANKTKNYKPELDRGIFALRHRGPDGNGSFYFENCAFGHTRLSIIDLSTGNQPMLSADNNLAITFNGEIYGYKDIKGDLKDYSFKTTSDTEVILALYEKYGSKMLEKLPGMFAFGIWDNKSETLFCARDRFGEKPFYYAKGENGEFVFASEIKAILATGLVKPILDKTSLLHYFKHLYINPNNTIYKNIFTLPPAHFLTYKNGEIKIEKYWTIPKLNEKISLTEATEKFKQLLDKAVSKQLIADVPVSAFLSGGLDSSTIVSVASKIKPNIQTISFGFGDSIDELPFAKAVSKKYDTKHIEIKSEEYNIAGLFLEMQEIYDEPFADSSNIPTYLISKSAKQYGKVVLTGDGGDELFGGYTGWYKPIYFALQKCPLKFSVIAKDLFNIIFKNSRDAKLDLYYRLQGFLSKFRNKNPLQSHIEKNTYFSDTELNKIFIDKIPNNSNIKKPSDLEDVMNYDLLNYMPGDILTKIDRASMAVGLELRSPFLDIDFASFCLSLPYNLKINDKEDKIILREAYKEDWPKEIINRGKQGFGAPVTEWLKTPSFIKLKEEFLNDKNKKIFEILNFNECQNAVKKDNYQTWILLTLSVWLEKHNLILKD
jgi:asparagine synthase (glutamine-hydrolysing)